MKRRWLIAIASLAMAITFVFGVTACKNDGKSDEEIAQTAINTLNSLYLKDGAVKNYETPDNYTVLGQVNVDGTVYPVTWTPTAKTENVNIADYVTVGETDNKGQTTIGITRTTVDVEYTLTASVTTGKVTKTAEYDHKIPKKSSEEAITATLDLSVKDNRTSLDTDNNEQVWKQNGITLTNSGNVADFVPVRLYKNTTVSIEMENAKIIHIDFHSAQGYTDSPYPEYLKTSLENSDLPIKGEITVSEDGLTIGVDFETAQEVVTFKTTAGQCRLTSIDVEAIERDPNEHVHKWTYEHVANTWTHTATCTAAGCDVQTKTEACTPKLNVCECGYTYTAKEIVDALFALETGKSLPGTYSLTGVVTNVEEVDTDTYKNATFDMEVEGQTIKAFRVKGAHYADVAVGGTATVNGELLDYGGTKEFTQGGSVVAFTPGVDERTADEKAEAALAKVAETLTITATGTQTLATSSEREVTFAWAVKSGDSLPDGITLADGKLSVTKLPEEEKTFQLVVTATIAEATQTHTKTVTVTVKPQGAQPQPSDGDGSKDSPFTVSQALEIIKGLAAYSYYTAGGADPVPVYVRGIVTVVGTSDNYGIKNFYIADAAGDTNNDVLIYSLNWSDTVKQGVTFNAGDTILVQAYLQNYDGEYEITYWREGTSSPYTYHNGYIVEHTPVGGTVDPDPQPTEGLLYTLTSTTKGENTNANDINSYTVSSPCTVDGITWDVLGNTQIGSDQYDIPNWRFGGKSTTCVDADRTITGRGAINGTVKSIVITFGATNGSITVNSVKLKVYNTDPGTGSPTPIATKDVEWAANGTYTVTADGEGWTNCYYQLVMNLTSTSTSNKWIVVDNIKFYADGGSTQPEPEENYGTLEKPLTVAEAIELAKTISGNGYLGGSTDPIEVYVKGYVISIDGWDSDHNDWTKVYIADTNDASATQKVQVYRLGLDTVFLKAQADLVEGAQITLFGCLQSYNGNAEVSHNPATDTNCKAVAYELPAHVHKWTYTYTSALKHTKVCNEAGCDLNKVPQTEACSPVANVCECGHTATEEEIIAAINGLASGASLPGTYELTGTVDSRGVVKTGTSGDWQFYIKVGTLTLEVYYASHDIVTASTLTEGDIVTVLGELKNYNGTKEFNSGAKITKWSTKSDDEKLQAIADKLKIYYDYLHAVDGDAILKTDNEVHYPTPNDGLFEGATLTWAFVESGSEEWFKTTTSSGTMAGYSGAYAILKLTKAPDVEKTFTLRATLVLEGKTKTKDFTIKLPVMTDEEKVDADVKTLKVATWLYLYEIGQSFDLRAVGTAGCAITWKLQEGTPACVAIETGKIVMKSYPDDVTKVVLVATITSGSVSQEKEFSITVQPDGKFVPMETPKAGYYYITMLSRSVGTRFYVTNKLLTQSNKYGNVGSLEGGFVAKKPENAIYFALLPVPNEAGKWFIKLEDKYLAAKYTTYGQFELLTTATESAKWSWDEERHTFWATNSGKELISCSYATSSTVQMTERGKENMETAQYLQFGTVQGEDLGTPKQATALEFYDAAGNKIAANTTIKVKAESGWSTVLYYKVSPADAISAVLTAASADATKAKASYGSALLGVYISTGTAAQAGDKTTVTFTVLDTTVSVTFNVEVVAADQLPAVKGETLENPMSIAELQAYVKKLDGVIEGAYAQVGSSRYFYVKGKLIVEDGSSSSRTCYLGDNKELSLGTLSASSLKDAAKAMGLQLADFNGVEVVVSGRWYLKAGEADAKTLNGSVVSIHQATFSANEKLALVKNNLTVDFTAFKTVDDEIDLAAAAQNAFGVAVAWTVSAPANASTYLSLTENLLKLVKLPEEATTFTLKATLTLEGGTDVTKEFTFFLAPAADVLFDMSKNTSTTSNALSVANAKSFLNTACGSNAALTGVTTATQVFKGNSSGGPFQGAGCMKLGASGKDAELVLTFGKKVTKVIIVWASWSASEGKLTVNDLGGSNFQAAFGMETFTLTTASDTLTLKSTGRVVITSMYVYFEAAVSVTFTQDQQGTFQCTMRQIGEEGEPEENPEGVPALVVTANSIKWGDKTVTILQDMGYGSYSVQIDGESYGLSYMGGGWMLTKLDDEENFLAGYMFGEMGGIY